MIEVKVLGFRTALWRRAVVGFVAVVSLSVLIIGIKWSFANPLPSFWDEGDYFSTSIKDLRTATSPISLHQKLLRFAKADVGEPPAHRIAFVAAIIGGPNLTVLRAISLFVTLASAWLVFYATRSACGAVPASFATLTIVLSPAVISSGIRYESEYPEFLALAGMVWSIVRGWPSRFDKRSAIALAASTGLGLWTKPTFAAIAAPMLIMTVLVARKLHLKTLPIMSKAITVGVVIGLIYLVPFSFEIFKYVERSTRGTRALIPGSPLFELAIFVRILTTTTLGPLGAVLAIALIVAIGRILLEQKRFSLEKPQVFLALFAIAGFVPVTILQFSSGNLDARYTAPAVYAIAPGLAAALAISSRRAILESVMIVIALFQLYLSLVPLFRSPEQRFQQFEASAIAGNHGDGADSMFPPTNQMNWEQLYAIVKDSKISDPSISYLGNNDAYNVHAIMLPWNLRDLPVRANLLWRFEDGPINWKHVMENVDRSDFVVVAPLLQGLKADKQQLDNVHDRSFLERLLGDKHMCIAGRLKLGSVDSTEVDVFENRNSGRCRGQR